MKYSHLFVGLVLSSLPLYSQSFTSASYPLPISGFNGGVEVKVADFNSDGRPDVLFIGNRHGRFGVLLNDQTGRLGTGITTEMPSVRSVEAGDFNNDKIMDVVACTQPSGGTAILKIMLGDGSGRFTPAGTKAVASCVIAAGDFNGDGRLDVANIGSAVPSVVAVHTGNGVGGFSKTTINSTNLGPCRLSGFNNFRADDLNGDGKPDIVLNEICDIGTPTEDPGGIVALYNDGTGHFAYQHLIDGGGIGGFTVADVNQDGLLDFIYKEEEESDSPRFVDTVTLALRQKGGSYALRTFYTRTYGELKTFGWGQIAAVDLDGDGLKDIVLPEVEEVTDGQEVTTYTLHFFYPTNNEYTSFKNTPRIVINFLPGNTYWADFNRDGRADLFIADGFGTAVNIFTNEDSNVPACNVQNANPRTLAVCRPLGGSSTPSPVQVKANITPGRPLTQVKIYIDGVTRFTGNEDLLNQFFNLSQGLHQVTVRAWDKTGAYSATHNFTVNGIKPACDPSPGNRTVNICSPLNGNTPLGSVRILATIRDFANSTAKVYVDGVAVLTTVDAMIDFSTPLEPGIHRVTVRAWDISGNFSSSTTFEVKPSRIDEQF